VADEAPRFAELVTLLAEHGVEFIIVGGVAAVLQGASLTTFDLDVLHRRTPENVDRLLRALASLGAVYRHDSRRLTPGPEHLLGPGHQLLSTSLGDLDVLGTIGANTTFEDVAARATRITLRGHAVDVLSLEDLIAAKSFADRPKDRAVLPLLRAVLEESRRDPG
jgi:predicted nucleotidyltransferase